jgi:enterochelin esterase-like enzyme
MSFNTHLIFIVLWLAFNVLFMKNPVSAQNIGIIEHNIFKQELSFESVNLHRKVHITVLLPVDYEKSIDKYPVLYLNDGQDLPRLKMTEVLGKLYQNQQIKPFILVGSHADKHRIQEYGTASQADYKQRGAKAGLHTKFILEELKPFIEQNYRVRLGAANTFFAGFSLGGLSAIDIVWHHADKFSKVGVFSGALWWRSKAYEAGYQEDSDRIIHNIIRDGNYQANLKFWFQTGTEDEKEDRNNNGIIDAIDDTLDLIKELQAKGYQSPQDIVYYEMEGGTHDPETWSKAMPVFLKWVLQ